MTKISETNRTEVDSFLVNPNLGHPIFLNIDPELKQNIFQIHLLFISQITDTKNFEKSIIKRINIVPIFEYKWKLKNLFEQMKKELELKKKEEKRGFWSRFKRWKKKEDKTEQKLFFDFERFSKLKPRAFRGDPILVSVVEVTPSSLTPISHGKYIKNEYCSPQDYLLRFDVFGLMENFYQVVVEFSLSSEVLEFLKRRDFIMFDILLNQEKGQNRINYHSLVISKKDWQDFTYVHATDLHIAERNDRIYGAIKQWIELFQSKSIDEIAESAREDLRLKIDENEEYVENTDNSIYEDSPDPLKKRLVNPNNQFRRFIKLMNKKVLQNDLDFVVLTGDLVDFTLLSKFPKDVSRYLDFDYEYSNWKIFKEIILNLPQKKRIGMVKGEELLCPIFTIPGNHDYRPFHYDIRWAGMYKKIGLRLDEALAINDKLLAIPISAISKSNRALRAYLSEVNPSLDYSIKLGKNNFIFLNSGSDSWKNFRDLISGHPSVTGLQSWQIKYLENLINYNLQDNENTFLFVHGPPINARKKVNLIQRLQKSLGKKILTKIDEFKESFWQKFGKTPTKARIDVKFNVKYGTISTNWEKLVQFCKDYCVLTLSGHTHELKEFRLGDPDGRVSKVFSAPPFSLKKLDNPAAIYYDLYSEIYTSSDDIEKFGPFVVQTPALGLGGYRNPKLVGAYREIIVREGKLVSFKIKFIHK